MLTAPATGEQSERVLALLTRFLDHLGEIDADVILDCGRLSPLAEATRAKGCSEATPSGSFRPTWRLSPHERSSLTSTHSEDFSTSRASPRLAKTVNSPRPMGSGPYGESEITEVLGAPVIARLPSEPDTAITLATTSTEARELRRTPLVRELRSLAVSLAPRPTQMKRRCHRTTNRLALQADSGDFGHLRASAPTTPERLPPTACTQTARLEDRRDTRLHDRVALRAEVLERSTDAQRASNGRRITNDDERELGRDLITEAIQRRAVDAIGSGASLLEPREEDALAKAVFDAIFGLDRLQRLLDDPSIENINANGCDQVFVRYAEVDTSASSQSPTAMRRWLSYSAPSARGWASANVGSTSPTRRSISRCRMDHVSPR